ncbi:hypothetical protein [Photobacterium sp. R1]
MIFRNLKGAVIPGLFLMILTGCAHTAGADALLSNYQGHYMWVDEPGNQANPLAVKAAKQVCGYEAYANKKYSYQKYQMFLCMEKLGVYQMLVPKLPDYESLAGDM